MNSQPFFDKANHICIVARTTFKIMHLSNLDLEMIHESTMLEGKKGETVP